MMMNELFSVKLNLFERRATTVVLHAQPTNSQAITCVIFLFFETNDRFKCWLFNALCLHTYQSQLEDINQLSSSNATHALR